MEAAPAVMTTKTPTGTFDILGFLGVSSDGVVPTVLRGEDVPSESKVLRLLCGSPARPACGSRDESVGACGSASQSGELGEGDQEDSFECDLCWNVEQAERKRKNRLRHQGEEEEEEQRPRVRERATAVSASVDSMVGVVGNRGRVGSTGSGSSYLEDLRAQMQDKRARERRERTEERMAPAEVTRGVVERPEEREMSVAAVTNVEGGEEDKERRKKKEYCEELRRQMADNQARRRASRQEERFGTDPLSRPTATAELPRRVQFSAEHAAAAVVAPAPVAAHRQQSQQRYREELRRQMEQDRARKAMEKLEDRTGDFTASFPGSVSQAGSGVAVSSCSSSTTLASDVLSVAPPPSSSLGSPSPSKQAKAGKVRCCKCHREFPASHFRGTPSKLLRAQQPLH